MQRLTREFEEQLRAESAGDRWIRVAAPQKNGRILNGGVFNLAEVLKLAPKVYTSERNRWLENTWLPPRLARLDRILKIDDNRRRFEDLTEAILQEQVVPFVGAGMSLLSGVPSWGALLDKLRLASAKCNEQQFKALIKGYKYEAAADLIHASMKSDLFNLQLNHSCRVDRNSIRGAVRYLPLLFSQLLLTTNFDQILEDVYKDEEMNISQVLPGADLASFRIVLKEKKTRLIKLHGDYEKPLSRIFTTQEYETAYREGSAFSSGFKNIVFNYNLLFIGASLINDRTYLLLRELAPYREGTHMHYAFLRHIPNQQQRLRRQEELADARILPIWYPVPKDGTFEDYDIQIEALLAGLLAHTWKQKFEE